MMKKSNNGKSALPIYSGVPPATTNAMTAALEKTISMVGLSSTKLGHGEKERGYVVKQNSLLKGLLCLVVLAILVLTIAFSTVLELKVTKRDWIMSEIVHNKRGHLEHEDFLRTSLELQEALEFSLDETYNLEEFRAYFNKMHGTNEDLIQSILVQERASPASQQRVLQASRDFGAEIQTKLSKMLTRFQAKTSTALVRVREIAKKMGQEIDLDARTQKNFEKRLEEWGVSDEYAENALDDYEDEEYGEDENPEDRAKRHNEQNESEKEIKMHVENFFKNLKTLQLVEIPPIELAMMASALGEFSKSLGVDSNEADIQAFNAQMDQMLAKYPTVERYSPKKHDSIVGHYEAVIESAKLFSHKQELMDMYNGWKSPGSKITEMNLLAAIEEMAEVDGMRQLFDLMEDEEDPSQANAAGTTTTTTITTKSALAKDQPVEPLPPQKEVEEQSR